MRVMPFDAYVARSVQDRRFTLILIATFAAVRCVMNRIGRLIKADDHASPQPASGGTQRLHAPTMGKSVAEAGCGWPLKHPEIPRSSHAFPGFFVLRTQSDGASGGSQPRLH